MPVSSRPRLANLAAMPTCDRDGCDAEAVYTISVYEDEKLFARNTRCPEHANQRIGSQKVVVSAAKDDARP